MRKIRLSLVSYTNTIPFIEGIKKSSFLIDKVELILDYPAKCAEKVLSGEVDGGLLPIGALPSKMEKNIITDYCIGADGFVNTVCLFSHKQMEEIDTIYLDYQSRTSVLLCQLIVQKYWKKDIQFIHAKPNFETKIRNNEAALIIGDRVFEYKHIFEYQYDLAQVWKEWTGLPFVFATWVGNHKVKKIEMELNKAFELGISLIPKLHNNLSTLEKSTFVNYLTDNISYSFDSKKKEGFELFKEMLLLI